MTILVLDLETAEVSVIQQKLQICLKSCLKSRKVVWKVEKLLDNFSTLAIDPLASGYKPTF